jgi:hypothetical protein
MKKILVIAAIVPLYAYVTTHGTDDSIVGQLIHSLFGLIMCLPVFGMVWMFWRFTRWHRGFHKRMAIDGIYRPRQ